VGVERRAGGGSGIKGGPSAREGLGAQSASACVRVAREVHLREVRKEMRTLSLAGEDNWLLRLQADMVACKCKQRRSVKAERFLLLEMGGGAVLMKAAGRQGQGVALNGSTEDVDTTARASTAEAEG
jgi:hypothetical protein